MINSNNIDTNIIKHRNLFYYTHTICQFQELQVFSRIYSLRYLLTMIYYINYSEAVIVGDGAKTKHWVLPNIRSLDFGKKLSDLFTSRQHFLAFSKRERGGGGFLDDEEWIKYLLSVIIWKRMSVWDWITSLLPLRLS